MIICSQVYKAKILTKLIEIEWRIVEYFSTLSLLPKRTRKEKQASKVKRDRENLISIKTLLMWTYGRLYPATVEYILCSYTNEISIY